MNQVLYWNAVAIEASRRDHSLGYMTGQQAGPTRTSRALAIVHLAIHDAIAFLQVPGAAYLQKRHAQNVFAPPGAQLEDAIDGAAFTALSALYPRYDQFFADALGSFGQPGFDFGRSVANQLLAARANDGSSAADPPPAPSQYGRHQPDPYNPTQGLLTTQWGDVLHFVGPRVALAPFYGSGLPPTYRADPNYQANYDEVLSVGALASGVRTPEQHEIGFYWGYDGANGIGVPPRLYNQIVRRIVHNAGLTEAQTAELFAEVNVAMADAGIDAWHWKYVYDLWRPVVGIRNETDPARDPFWAPLGIPLTNQRGRPPTTPPFPAYPSGHATFGAAMFQMMRLHGGGSPMTVADVMAEETGPGPGAPGEAFSFVSDELDGRAFDNDGSVRTRRERTYPNYARPVWENSISRLYLGVHWRMDGLPANPVDNVGGVPLGLTIGQQAHSFFTTGPSIV